MSNYSPGVDMISEARREQIEKGFDVEHDTECHSFDELIAVASCYISAASDMAAGVEFDWPHPFWPEGTGIPPKLLDSSADMAVRGGAWLAAALDLLKSYEA